MFDLSKFSVPKDFRGKNPIVVQTWWFVHFFLLKCHRKFLTDGEYFY